MIGFSAAYQFCRPRKELYGVTISVFVMPFTTPCPTDPVKKNFPARIPRWNSLFFSEAPRSIFSERGPRYIEYFSARLLSQFFSERGQRYILCFSARLLGQFFSDRGQRYILCFLARLLGLFFSDRGQSCKNYHRGVEYYTEDVLAEDEVPV